MDFFYFINQLTSKHECTKSAAVAGLNITLHCIPKDDLKCDDCSYESCGLISSGADIQRTSYFCDGTALVIPSFTNGYIHWDVFWVQQKCV